MAKSVLIAAFALVALFILKPYAAYAAHVSTLVQVTATGDSACQITGVTDLKFSPYNPFVSTNNDSGMAQISLTCTTGTAYWVYISGPRTLAGPSASVNFQLYKDPGRSLAWEQAKSGSPTVSPSTAPQSVDVYGRIPGGQIVPGGDYAGMVTLNVEF